MRLLHTMLRVGDLDRSIKFYTEVLDMKLLRQKDYPEGKFTLAFVGYGKESEHALSNTGPRTYLVCEFDHGTADEHAAILYHLALFAPLVMVVHSGGKSLHGWFYVKGEPEDNVAAFFRYACKLGADKATWTRSQFVRMPQGVRENGNVQAVYYYNHKLVRRIHDAG